HYLDDFNQPQSFESVLTIEVTEPDVEESDSGDAEPQAGEEMSLWQRILRVIRGLFGLGSWEQGMNWRDLFHLVRRNLMRMKLRVAMTAMGVLIGTAAIILVISLGIGLQRANAESLSSLGELTAI